MLLEHLVPAGRGDLLPGLLGDKDDVSGTDMLQWWESDGETKLALLYLESIGNPPVRPHRPPRRPYDAGADRGRGPVRGGGRLAGARAARAATPLVTGRPCSSTPA